ncbi:MAG: hypothetical protein IKU83_03485 [Lachnospiraceae bacterium]|nr:hypothetical protein [Lachnospiraceae bacterium]
MKRWVAFVLAAIMTFTMIGCGGKEKEDLNAEQYVTYAKGLMDASFHGEYTTYMELTGATEDEAQARYENRIIALAEGLAEYFLIETRTAEVNDRLYAIAEEMYQLTTYKVEAAVLDETTKMYTVNIVVTPMAYLQDVEEPVSDYLDDLNDRMIAREFEDMSDAEYEALYTEGMLEILEEYLPTASYVADETIKVTFQYDEASQTTFISDADLEKVARVMFAE